ncbi:MAG: hypothetical protein ACLGIN_11715 [Candidatus Sericytochromatia bacterium]
MRLPFGIPFPRALYFAIGFAPIAALCFALFGFVPLHLSAKFFVLPALAIGVAYGLRHRRWGRLALTGFLAGIVATGAYDVLRLGLVWAGMWGDFIPAIGRMALLDHQAHPFWGYLWRFIGNGGGMGLAFAMLPWRHLKGGVVYGTVICFCLFGTILLAPHASRELFTLGPATAAGALAGHWVYGAILGWLAGSWGRAPEAIERVVPQGEAPMAERREADSQA